jgi:hypothetical protein
VVQPITCWNLPNCTVRGGDTWCYQDWEPWELGELETGKCKGCTLFIVARGANSWACAKLWAQAQRRQMQTSRSRTRSGLHHGLESPGEGGLSTGASGSGAGPGAAAPGAAAAAADAAAAARRADAVARLQELLRKIQVEGVLAAVQVRRTWAGLRRFARGRLRLRLRRFARRTPHVEPLTAAPQAIAAVLDEFDDDLDPCWLPFTMPASLEGPIMQQLLTLIFQRRYERSSLEVRFRHESDYKVRVKPFMDDQFFRKMVRLDRPTFFELRNQLRPVLRRHKTPMRPNPLTVGEQLWVALRFLASGAPFPTVADAVHYNTTTVPLRLRRDHSRVLRPAGPLHRLADNTRRIPAAGAAAGGLGRPTLAGLGITIGSWGDAARRLLSPGVWGTAGQRFGWPFIAARLTAPARVHT